MLALTRLEMVVIVAVLLAGPVVSRQRRCPRHFILGGLPALALLLAYNASQFGNPLHAGILTGDMNVLAFDLSYALATLVRPQSGSVLGSTLTVLGIVGLFARPATSLKAPGWTSLKAPGWTSLKAPGWTSLALVALITAR